MPSNIGRILPPIAMPAAIRVMPTRNSVTPTACVEFEPMLISLLRGANCPVLFRSEVSDDANQDRILVFVVRRFVATVEVLNLMVDLLVGQRVSAKAELEGLDLPEMGALGYPEFELKARTLGA